MVPFQTAAGVCKLSNISWRPHPYWYLGSRLKSVLDLHFRLDTKYFFIYHNRIIRELTRNGCSFSKLKDSDIFVQGAKLYAVLMSELKSKSLADSSLRTPLYLIKFEETILIVHILINIIAYWNEIILK